MGGGITIYPMDIKKIRECMNNFQPTTFNN